MADPLAELLAFLDSDAAALPVGTTSSVAFPTTLTDHLHVQFAWDGSPSDADNRETAAVRIVVWGPKGKPTEVNALAGELRARLLAWDDAPETFRVDRGAGRNPGVDPDTKLVFCTFSVNLVLHALTP